jgi:hypothetical protein
MKILKYSKSTGGWLLLRKLNISNKSADCE